MNINNRWPFLNNFETTAFMLSLWAKNTYFNVKTKRERSPSLEWETLQKTLLKLFIEHNSSLNISLFNSLKSDNVFIKVWLQILRFHYHNHFGVLWTWKHYFYFWYYFIENFTFQFDINLKPKGKNIWMEQIE